MILILVHPGSMFGSADYNLGWRIASAAREDVLSSLDDLEGGLVVIDGALSDEIDRASNARIEAALDRAAAAGHLALRLWGDDSGERPFEGWQGRGDLPAFDSQEDAARSIADRLTGPVVVTGAWASDDDPDTGCVNSVVLELRGLGLSTLICENALRIPEETEDDLELDS